MQVQLLTCVSIVVMGLIHLWETRLRVKAICKDQIIEDIIMAVNNHVTSLDMTMCIAAAGWPPCRKVQLLFTILAVLCCTALIVVVAEEEDDSMSKWLKVMAETSGSDADPDYDSPYENSYVAQADGAKTGASVGMFVKFPKPQGKSRKVTVSKSGKDDFTTINAALDSIAEHTKSSTSEKASTSKHPSHHTSLHSDPSSRTCADFCFIGREKIFINASKPYISFVGDGQEKTIIQWGDKASDFDDEDQLLKTYKSATVGVNSQYFIAENIQFRVKQNIFLDF